VYFWEETGKYCGEKAHKDGCSVEGYAYAAHPVYHHDSYGYSLSLISIAQV